MAETGKDRNDLDETDEAAPEDAKPKPGRKALLVKGGIALVAISALGVGGWMWFAKKGGKSSPIEIAAPKKMPKYYAFDPSFVVNFTENDHIRYLQVSVELMTYDEKIIADMQPYIPLLRNNLIMLFSNITFDDISTMEGKNKLREEALFEVQGVLEQKIGNKGVEELYFTNFVMQ